ncbi:MAG: HipA N-terminal domain-containing protein [Bacteroidota bacterium]
MKGIVYYNDQAAGVIEQTDEGYQFRYHAEYVSDPNAKPVTQTLPLRAAPYVSKTMFPFFDGLIPEGWLLDVAAETLKINPRDRMMLLLTVCRDCIGAVKVVKTD